LEQENSTKVDLLIICGDFQAIRNLKDLDSMAVPDKYKQIGYFWKYYSGQVKAPVL
jgi:lariat debranching enzyme